MIYFLSFFIVIGLPVFLHELGHYLAARSVGIKVEKFYIGFNLFGLGLKKKIKETEYGIGLFPLGGYVKVAGILDESLDTENSKREDYEFRSKNTFQKIWFLSAGVLMNFILSSIIFTFFIFIDGYADPIDIPVINKISKEIPSADGEMVLSPAHELGLKGGDEILSINNYDINTWSSMTDIVRSNPNIPMNISWSREGVIYNDIIIPYSVKQFVEGEIINIGIIGIQQNFNTIYPSFFMSIFKGFEQTSMILIEIAYSLRALFTGSVSMGDFFGPLYLVKVAGDAAQTGLKSLFLLTAMISVNLGLINILPIPGLDGGHVFIALIEGLIRRELPLKIKYAIQLTGFLIIMSLFILVLYNDINHLM